MKTATIFDNMTADQRGRNCAIAYGPAAVRLVFCPIGQPQLDLTPEQIAKLPETWRTRYAEAQKESEVTGCTLLAGENSEVVATGSLYFCRQSLSTVLQKHLPRDPYSGKGCWAIVRGEQELASGYFDGETVY